MKMVSMKKSSTVGMPEQSMPVKMNPDEYPYGLKVCLSEEELKKLGIEELPDVGEKMKLMAVVEVCRVSMDESKMYGESRNLDLQIVEMALSGGGEKKEEGESETVANLPAEPMKKAIYVE